MSHASRLQVSQESSWEEAVSPNLREVRTSSFREVLQAGRLASPNTPIPASPMSTISMMASIDVLTQGIISVPKSIPSFHS